MKTFEKAQVKTCDLLSSLEKYIKQNNERQKKLKYISTFYSEKAAREKKFMRWLLICGTETLSVHLALPP